MPVKLLLDENVSPHVALALRAAGIDAVHVRDRSMFGAADREVLRRALAEDRVLVTANVADFMKLVVSRNPPTHDSRTVRGGHSHRTIVG